VRTLSESCRCSSLPVLARCLPSRQHPSRQHPSRHHLQTTRRPPSAARCLPSRYHPSRHHPSRPAIIFKLQDGLLQLRGAFLPAIIIPAIILPAITFKLQDGLLQLRGAFLPAIILPARAKILQPAEQIHVHIVALHLYAVTVRPACREIERLTIRRFLVTLQGGTWRAVILTSGQILHAFRSGVYLHAFGGTVPV
jgi:hypothetical protein